MRRNWTGYIRGEITLTKQTIVELMELTKKTYKCLRNATAGLINAKEATDEEISTLRFFAYEDGGQLEKPRKNNLIFLNDLVSKPHYIHSLLIYLMILPARISTSLWSRCIIR